MIAASHQWRCVSAGSVITVIAADVDPLQSIGRPGPAPAAAVISVVAVRSAKERKAMEAMVEAMMERVPVESGSRKAGRESSVRKARTCEMAAAEVHAAAHAAEMHSSAVHATPPPPPCMPPPMPPPCMPPPPPRHACRHLRRRDHRHRHREQAPVTQAQAPSRSAPAMRHLRSLLPISDSSQFGRRDGYCRKKTIRRAKSSNDFKLQRRQFLTAKLVSPRTGTHPGWRARRAKARRRSGRRASASMTG